MAKYSLATKLKAIDLYQNGLGTTRIAKKLKIGERGTILQWLYQWHHQGLTGLIRAKQLPNYSVSFKMKIINWLVTHQASYPEAARHFGIASASTVWHWHQ
ncbi:Transposase and inactivated derivatives, partial [Leuconostocaceae bacterium R-53105]